MTGAGLAGAIYRHGKLLLSIVERNRGEEIVAVTKRAGARGGTIVMGRGTAQSSVLQLLGIGDTGKDVVLTLATDEQVPPIMSALREHARAGRHPIGIAMLIDVSHILKHVLAPEPAPSAGSPAATSPSAARRSPVKPRADHVLITFIVNRGYADDAMAAARKAGATGGTILHARGTGTEEDVKFFGVSLVPEKDILLTLVDAAEADHVLQAVKEAPFLSEPGSGIAFCIDVEEYLPLGKRA